ncbi:efflux RND transporter permease subunit, partial [Acinetobacter baumannii]|uniref:efflux RND transporter permease subunit n=1 Tax=Acinetobacter baumannii TaxID=470 RepID=UPI0037D27112
MGKVAEDIEIFYNGKVSTQILDGQKTFDIVLRTSDSIRNNLDEVGNTQIATSDGALIPLKQIAQIEMESGVNSVYHENTLRRIVVS